MYSIMYMYMCTLCTCTCTNLHYPREKEHVAIYYSLCLNLFLDHAGSTLLWPEYIAVGTRPLSSLFGANGMITHTPLHGSQQLNYPAPQNHLLLSNAINFVHTHNNIMHNTCIELNIFPSMSLMNLMLFMEATRMGGVVKKNRNTNSTVEAKRGGACTCSSGVPTH